MNYPANIFFIYYLATLLTSHETLLNLCVFLVCADNGPKEEGLVVLENLPYLLQCGVSITSMDLVSPPLLRGAVWSWSMGYPGELCACMRKCMCMHACVSARVCVCACMCTCVCCICVWCVCACKYVHMSVFVHTPICHVPHVYSQRSSILLNSTVFNPNNNIRS